MQPPPPDLSRELTAMLADLLDAKWVITTLIAIYAAIVSSFNAFIKDWWTHRPRIKLIFMEAQALGANTVEELLGLNVINKGYQERKFQPAIGFEIRELLKEMNGTVFFIPQPQFNPGPPGMLSASDSFTIYFPLSTAVSAAREKNLRGAFHARAYVQDGTNRRFDSPWLKLDAGN